MKKPVLSKRTKAILIVVSVVLILFITAFIARGSLRQTFFYPTESNLPTGTTEVDRQFTETIATKLTVPWGLAVLPTGDILVTERSGTLRRLGEDQQLHTIEGVAHVGEGGLLGIALHPQFEDNRYLYLYLTTQSGDGLVNRVERYKYQDNGLSDKKLILGAIPGAANHDGGRLAFGPDGYLYVTTGDAGQEEAAQDTDSLAGKILRITDEGQPAPDNPFGNAVYSYGHRNPQGIAWDKDGRLWSSEHGRSGLRSGFDEINLIESGVNYGWPVIQGDEKRDDMRAPVVHSGENETWAPASLAYVDGQLFFGGLRGESLYQATIRGDTLTDLKVNFNGQFGRIREATLGTNNEIFITTSNTDGRGTPGSEDDRIIRLNKSIFGL